MSPLLLSLWVMMQFIVLSLSVAAGSVLASNPTQTLLIVAASALVLAHSVCWVANALARSLRMAPNAPPVPTRIQASEGLRLPGEPGTPGNIRARAPAFVVQTSF